MKVEIIKMGIVCDITIDLGITLWQAIKLRIAGKAYMPIAEKIGNEIVRRLTAASTEQLDKPSASK